MLSLSPLKIVIIVVVALVLVGPDKLPGLARQIGGAWRAFRSFSTKVESEVRSTMPDLPSTGDIARLARSPVAFLDSLAKLDLDPDPGAVEPEVVGGLQVDPAAPHEEPTTYGDPTLLGRDEPEELRPVENPLEDHLIPTEPISPPPSAVVRPAPPVGPGGIDPTLN